MSATVTTMSGKVHQGKPSRIPGKVVTLCNGRTQAGTMGTGTSPDLCKRCFA